MSGNEIYSGNDAAPKAYDVNDFMLAMHLDFKGVQFRPEYLPQLLSDLAAQGINTLLVEYEDIFPFANLDIATDPETAWSPRMVQEFQEQAHALNLEVIPLQQCLGHLEYLFCWDDLRHLALNHDYPSTLNIFNQEAKALVRDMLREVLEAHPGSRYVHLGLDEAFSLIEYAKQQGESVCRWFVEYTETLCDLCDEYGKKPLIWSDILEHHLTPDDLPIIERLRDRVVICTWDYTTREPNTPFARWGGNFVSRDWLQTPGDASAPTLNGKIAFLDEMPEALGTQLRPYRVGKTFSSIFQADLWTKLGFETFGTTAVRISYDGPSIPYYNWRWKNIELWAQVAKSSGQVGIIASSWARGTSWCWPNYSFDLTWPLTHALTSALGAAPQDFYAGIKPETMIRIFQTLGRCRENWKRETAVVAEMEQLAPALQAHHHEWQSTILMAKVLSWQKRASFAVDEVEDFWSNYRPVDSEWQRRLDDQAELLEEAAILRSEVVAHFAKRYWGKAFDEWVSTLFDIYCERVKRCFAPTHEKLTAARLEHSTHAARRNIEVMA